MSEFDNFPYANTERLNLDWILKKIKELETRVAALEEEQTSTENTES